MSLNHPWGQTFRAGSRSRAGTVQAQAEFGSRSESRAERERELLEELRRTEELEALVRGLSHRFNNDLHVIGGHAELIAGGASIRQTQASAHIIRSSVGRMERTFRDVLLCALSGQAELSLVDVAAH